jgi:type IV pilus assembly protein PilB
MNNPSPPLSGLARRLVTDNLLDAELANKAVTQAKKDKIPFVQHLVNSGILDARTLARIASEEFGSPVFDLDALNKDMIKFNTGTNTEAVLVEADKLKNAIERYLNSQEENLGEALGGLDGELEDLDIEAVDENAKHDDPGGSEADEAPIVKYINKVLLDAIKGGSSDIHFEPYEKSYRIRFRTDGVLHEVSRPPVNLATRMAARLKVMSQMDKTDG